MTDLSPLQGVRILDMTHYWAGPHAVRILADFGAEVIKIEYPKRLCVMRGARVEAKAYNHHPRWHQVNRNKLSVTLDLNTDNDRGLLARLVGISDIVVSNFRGGVMENLGFGYEELCNMNPDILVISMPAYGNIGPYRSYTGVGASIEAVSGIQSLTAYELDGRCMRIRELDVIAGVMGACAMITALVNRQRTGKGQYVDMSQMEADTHALIGEHLLEVEMNGAKAFPMGNRHRRFAPHGCYKCKGDDKWVAITVRSDEEWQILCKIIGRPELTTSQRFNSYEKRKENHDEIDQIIESWTILRSHYDVMHDLQLAGIPAGAVLSVEEIIADPHLRKRNYFQFAAEGLKGRFPGPPFRLSNGSGTIRRLGPDLGEHNQYVIHNLLGEPAANIHSVNENEIRTGFDPE